MIDVPYVNAHTHLELGMLADICPQGQPFTEWIMRLVARRMAMAPEDYRHAIEYSVAQGIETLIAAGTVAVGDISATGLSVEPLLQSGLAGVVYYEVLGLDPTISLPRFAEAQGKIDTWRRNEQQMRVGLTIHAPYSCAPALFEAAAAWCLAEDVPLAIHIAESPDEVRYLKDGSGPMGDINARFSPRISWEPPACSPIQYLARLGVLETQPTLIHGVQVNSDDLALIKASGCKVVHCPRSNINLQCGRMPLEKYLDYGIPVALGTDSLASAQSLDIRDELHYAATLHQEYVSEEALLSMATTNGLAVLKVNRL